MLTLSTQIPTIARGAVRSLCKAHSDWALYLNEKGLISANARNADLIAFALRYPDLTAKIEAILNGSAPDAQDVPETPEADDMAIETETAETVDASGFALDSVLSGVDQLLSPLVRKEIAKALQPVIDAANKGPVTIEVERIVEVAPGEKPLVTLPKARRDKATTFRTLYPSKAKDAWRDAKLTLWTGAKSPAVDPFYVVDHAQMASAMVAIEAGMNVWATGNAGTGKSSLFEQIAAALGRPFCKIGMTRQTEIESLIGGLSLRSGSTVWEDGVLIKAMRQPGMVILIDELTFAPAGVQAIIQLIADDHRSYTLPTGETVKCADGVVFCVADNTNGGGDDGGLYAGTNVSNAACVDRFGIMLIVDYMSAAKEAEALANHTACPVAAARQLTDFVAQVRRNPALAGVVVSMRRMVAFMRMVQRGFSPKDAFDMAITSRMPATERATITAMVDLAWHQAFEALVHGTAARGASDTATPAVAPSNSPASKAFADEQF